jgi:ADP-ribose pyrophosphatase YjhB (NUDIX family)
MQTHLEKQLTVSGFVLRADGRVLLVNHPKLGAWIYPGGHVEPHEVPDQSLLREIKEETGLDVRLLDRRPLDLEDAAADVSVLHRPYLVLCEYISDPIKPHYHIDMIYLCAVVSGDLAFTAEVREAGFFNESEAATLPLFPAFRRLLARVFQEPNAWAALSVKELLT